LTEAGAHQSGMQLSVQKRRSVQLADKNVTCSGKHFMTTHEPGNETTGRTPSLIRTHLDDIYMYTHVFV